jgi:hypothetical protein
MSEHAYESGGDGQARRFCQNRSRVNQREAVLPYMSPDDGAILGVESSDGARLGSHKDSAHVGLRREYRVHNVAHVLLPRTAGGDRGAYYT